MNIPKGKFIMALGLAALASPISSGYANDAPFTITSQVLGHSPNIIIRSQYDFEKQISLKVTPDPRLLPSDVLIKTVSNMGMRDANGIRITSGFDIDRANNLVLAFSGGTSEIIKSASSASGITITASFKDAKGNFVAPPAGSLALYTLGGEKLCFEYNDVAKHLPKMAFVLLLDRSGSMANVIEDVRTSAQTFLKALPPQSKCAVASFNGVSTYHNKYYQDCNTGDFNLSSLKAGGGTELYTPLSNSYRNLSLEYFKDYQKAVIVITDGQISEDKERRLKLLAAKNDILTFVYFLGEKNDQYLIGLADGFLKSSADIKASLDKYFGSISSAYNSQRVLEVKKCDGGKHAKAN